MMILGCVCGGLLEGLVALALGLTCGAISWMRRCPRLIGTQSLRNVLLACDILIWGFAISGIIAIVSFEEPWCHRVALGIAAAVLGMLGVRALAKRRMR